MPTYIILINLTNEGIKAVKKAPAQVKAMAEAMAWRGGSLHHGQ